MDAAPARPPSNRFRAAALGFRTARSGVAAVEFALVLPLMLILFYGLSEVALGYAAQRKLTILSGTVAGLSGKEKELPTNEMAAIFSAASAIMRPNDASLTQMVISSVVVTKSGTTYTGKIDWSCGKNIPTGTWPGKLATRPRNDTYPVPTEIQHEGTKSFILVETLHPFVSAFSEYIVGTRILKQTTPWPVTASTGQVVGPSSCPPN